MGFVFRHRGLMDKGSEHGAVGLRECLPRRNIARYMIWGGLRALDYLAGLSEVDPARIGGYRQLGPRNTYHLPRDARCANRGASIWWRSIISICTVSRFVRPPQNGSTVGERCRE